ncbi:MAG: hypothetical protein PVJ21_05960 [Anaerolineales bacterium]|jgi:hypothetical protein
MSKQRDKLSPENIESLEAHLAGTLRPVAPPKDFVQRLRDRIHLPERDVIISRLRDWNRLFLVFGSVMSGMVILITVARALYYLVGRRKMA